MIFLFKKKKKGHRFDESQVQTINQEINQLIEEKRIWEIRIRDLGGRNFLKGQEEEKLSFQYFGTAKHTKDDAPQAEPTTSSSFDSIHLLSQKWEISPDQLTESYYGVLPLPQEFALTKRENALEVQLISEAESLRSKTHQDHPEDWIVVDQELSIPDQQEFQDAILEIRKQAILTKLGL